MRQLTLVCQQSSKVLPQSHHILQHSIAHQCWTCSVQVQRQVINCCCCCCKKCVLACASLAVNKEALACSFSRAPALPLNTHDALIRQEASPSQRLATCLIFLFCLVVVHKQQSNANLADATNYARMLPRRTHYCARPVLHPKQSVPSLIKRSCTVDSLRLVSFAHRERTNASLSQHTNKCALQKNK